MKIIAVTVLFLTNAVVTAQVPEVLWQRTYGGYADHCRALAATSDGGFILAGHGGIANSQYTLVRIGSNGDSLWSRMYGGASEDECWAVDQTRDGGYVVFGTTNSFGDGYGALWLLKTDSHGDSLWSALIEDAEPYQFVSCEATDDSGVVVVGTIFSGESHEDCLLNKYSKTGALEWSKNFGGPYSQNGIVVHRTLDGGYIVGGKTREPPSEGSVPHFLIVKTNSNGDSLWSKRFGRPGGESFTSAIECSDGGFLVSGFDGTGTYVGKTNNLGDSLWSRRIEFNGGTLCAAEIEPLKFVLGGWSSTPSDDFILICISSDGDSLWSETFGGPGEQGCFAMDKDRHGGLLLAGYTLYPIYDFMAVRVIGTNEAWLDLSESYTSELESVFSSDTIRWTGVGFEGGVSISLNRHYPIGPWEVITSETENDGEYEWFVTDPLSDSCRIRICAVQDTFCDISDGNFSIVSSQGYLALVKSSAPNTPVLNWNAGVTECPSAQEQFFRLKNFGSEAVVVFQPLEPTSNEFSRTTACGSFFALAPNQMSACSLALSFQPSADGTYYDTLRVQTDAVNGVGGYVKIPLAGTQISTPAPPQVVITTQGEDAHLYWSAVDTSLGGCAVTVERYLVFYSPTEAGPYYYHGWTAGTTYTHAGVVTYATNQFYQVVATDAPAAALASLREGMEMGEALGMIQNFKLDF